MAEPNCPHCRGRINTLTSRCVLCGTLYQANPGRHKVGDRIRIRNRFKGGKVEDVEVIRVVRDGHGLEVKDDRGLTWGYIFPADVLAKGA